MELLSIILRHDPWVYTKGWIVTVAGFLIVVIALFILSSIFRGVAAYFKKKDAQKEEEYRKKFANPYEAAKFGYIDDVIEPRNTRFRVIRALRTLETKRLANPEKKHSNIPL